MAVWMNSVRGLLVEIKFEDMESLRNDEWKLVLKVLPKNTLNVALSSGPEILKRRLLAKSGEAQPELNNVSEADVLSARESIVLATVTLIEKQAIVNPWINFIQKDDLSPGSLGKRMPWPESDIDKFKGPFEKKLKLVPGHGAVKVLDAPELPGLGSDPAITYPYREPGDNGLDPKYTFDSFQVGASNQFAHAAAYAIAETIGKDSRPGAKPLLIYSEPGLGKTHLLHAIGNHALSKNSRLRVIHLSSERFVNELIDSIGKNRMREFRTKYRNSFDLILLDDLSFISGKSRTQEELLHTLIDIEGSKCQVVFGSVTALKEMEFLHDGLASRLEGRLVAEIHPPEVENRCAILKAKAWRDDIEIGDEAIELIAKRCRRSVRELEGFLIRICAVSNLTGVSIDSEMVLAELEKCRAQ